MTCTQLSDFVSHLAFRLAILQPWLSSFLFFESYICSYSRALASVVPSAWDSFSQVLMADSSDCLRLLLMFHLLREAPFSRMPPIHCLLCCVHSSPFWYHSLYEVFLIVYLFIIWSLFCEQGLGISCPQSLFIVTKTMLDAQQLLVN